ncbi:MAG TPA: hypothetical protein VGI45_17760 [Terracidiphilus sp.]|jgi:hypothetical protein
MKIVVLAERFEEDVWRDWEHVCNEDEAESIFDSANAKAADHMHPRPSYIDYLMGAVYIFDVARGTPDDPRNGDTRVYGAIVDEMLIGIRDKVERHFLLKDSAA